MLSRLIELSLQHRAVVLLATLLLVAWGVWAFRSLPLDAFPDTTPVQVTVNTVAPSLTPVEVEQQITLPIERTLGGLPGLLLVRSLSKFGFSQVTVVFEDDVDVYFGRQLVSERLSALELPGEVGRPSLGPVATGLGEVFQYVLRSDRRSAMELRTLHDWVIRPQLLSVPGVAEINSWGGYARQLHVVIDPERLIQHRLTLVEVSEALRRNNRNVGGGVVHEGGEASLIHGVGLATSAEEIEAIVITAREGVPVTIGDVGRVEPGHEIRRGAVTAGGEGEVVLGLGFMLMGENSQEVTAALEARLEEVSRGLPGGVTVEPLYRRTELVEQVLETVRGNLLEGALLVVAVLFLMMGSLRAGLIVALAIPLSMLFAFDMMLRFGVTGSLMSLGAIDFGLVVDSSVIMVENAHRRLEEDTSDRSVIEVVRDAAVEVRRPTLFGELIIMIVYLPVLALEGVEGKLFQPMALTVIFALAGSMILSMTLMPVLASLALTRREGRRRGDNVVVRGLKRLYRPALGFALRNRWSMIGAAALVVANAGVLALQLGSEFMPRLREQAVVINTVRLAGVSLEESVRYGTRIEQRLLREFPDEIAHVWTRTGTAEVATDPMGLELSDVFITLTPREAWTRGATQDELVSQMSASLEGMPGMRMIFTQPIEMRVNEMLAGIRADVGVTIYGDDFAVMGDLADQVLNRVTAIPGAADVTREQLTGAPVLQITVRRDAIARHGISADHVLATIEALGTLKVGEVRDGEQRFDLVVRLEDRYRGDPEAIQEILLTAPGGERIPLRELTNVERVESPSTIHREWGKRRMVIQANVRGRDVGSFVADVQRAVDEVRMPEGYFVRLGGQFENMERAKARLMWVVPAALLLILTLLYVTYGRAIDAARVFTGVPFAAAGGVVALWLRGMPFSISAGVGFIALSGVAVLGDMVLVSTIEQLRAQGVEGSEAIRRAAEGRLRPVLMTATVAALGFLPMALNTGVGAEVQRPLATVVVGGMVTATLATLLILPAMYAATHRDASRLTQTPPRSEGAASP